MQTTPFSQLIVTGLYDGPTHGFALRSGDPSVVLFEMLDWDAAQDVRIFVLRSGTGTMAELEATFGRPERTPTWMPAAPLSPPAEELLARWRTQAEPFAIVACEDLLREWIACKAIDAPLLDSRDVDWFRVLGISRAGDLSGAPSR